MSFRSRLRVFFMIIVIVPMAAVALVLFTITEDSETGKADARLAAALRTGFALWGEAVDDARPALLRVARDAGFDRALAAGDRATARRRLAALVRSDGQIRSAVLYDNAGRAVARAGAADAVAPATVAPRTESDRRIGTLAVSVTSARELARAITRFTALDVRITRAGELAASTLPGDAGERLASGDSEVGGREYRGRIQTFGGAVGPPVQLGVFQNAEELSDSVQDSRLLIGGILLAFLILALLSSVFVVRALQGQVQQFLVAARRLGEGDFKQRVPVEGSDEFAALGEQFNSMSEQLSTQIDEVERKRRQLEEAIRRVGEAFAAGLDREGVVDLAVRTALDALGAEAGRAIPVDPEKMPAASVGATDERFVTALEAAERKAFAADPAYGVELLTVLDSTVETPEQRRPVVADIGEVHALALPLRAHLGAIGELQYVGVVSVARAANPFSREERDLFGYLASQAVVSIENVDLHETVQLQAVTDELTRLFNVRHLHDFLDGEVERSRRFGTGIGLILMDIDDFKRVNDTHGHQQGDVVLVEVARVLREHSRNIDEPARYGGEELALVLPQTDVARAGNAAERIRAAIERLRIPRLDGGAPLAVTASFGVAALPESASDKEELIAAADAALYRAKAAGKNRVEHAEPLAAPR